jgi:hypothetical protein
MTITDTPVDNGVDPQALLDAREALSADPAPGDFQWRASCTWLSGTHSYTTVHDFGGLGAEQAHVREFGYDVDHPECFASDDNGPAPTEFVLVALAGCLTAGIATVDQMRGIQLRSVTATLSGDMSVLGVLGADPDVRNGYDSIKVTYRDQGLDTLATRRVCRAQIRPPMILRTHGSEGTAP